MRKEIHNFDKIREIPYNEKFICMFSGGKDCGLALSKAIEHNCIPIALIHCMCEPQQRSLFHKQQRAVAEAQSSAIGVPLKCIEYKWWREWKETIELFEHYRNQGVKFVLYGDLGLDEIVENHVYLCELAGLKPCVPLFHMDYSMLMDEMEKHEIVSVITEVDPLVLGREWLGKKYNREVYSSFVQMEIDPYGENGEFHTTLINADFFRHSIKYNEEIMCNQHLKIDVLH